jgi:DNA-binding response OmpR family regulator
MPSCRILLVDDDPDILQIVAENLELDGYTVCVASKGRDALKIFAEENVGLVILDLSLPDIDGIQVCRLIRDRSVVPMIILTARDRTADKLLAFETGADDYVVKPFDYLELSARIRACLRRRQTFGVQSDVVQFGEIKIDSSRNLVLKCDKEVRLTRKEFELLLLLGANAGKVVNRAVIRDSLWQNKDLYGDSRAIDVHIQHLRFKLEDDPSSPKYIRTISGVGYMLAVEPERKD